MEINLKAYLGNEAKALSYPFLKLYFNLFLMCVWLCFYFLSLFNVSFVAHAFSYSIFCSCVLISLCCILMLDANFLLTVPIIFSLPILTFFQ